MSESSSGQLPQGRNRWESENVFYLFTCLVSFRLICDCAWWCLCTPRVETYNCNWEFDLKVKCSSQFLTSVFVLSLGCGLLYYTYFILNFFRKNTGGGFFGLLSSSDEGLCGMSRTQRLFAFFMSIIAAFFCFLTVLFALCRRAVVVSYSERNFLLGKFRACVHFHYAKKILTTNNHKPQALFLFFSVVSVYSSLFNQSHLRFTIQVLAGRSSASRHFGVDT